MKTPLLKPLVFAAALAASISSAQAESSYLEKCFAPAKTNNGKFITYEKKTGPFRLAFVNGYNGNDWRKQSIQAAKAWAARPENAALIKEFTVVSVGNDSAAQISKMNEFIDGGYDGIIFIAVDPKAFEPVLKKAASKKVVLVPFDNILDSDKVVQINEDQFQLGVLKAEAVVGKMAAKEGHVLVVRGLPGNATDRDNHAGMLSVLSKHPGIKVIEEVGDWNAETVEKVTASALKKYKFSAVIVQEGAIGAINALNAAKHPVVPMAGDAGNGFRQALVRQNIPGLSAAQAPAMSATALQAVVALLNGEKLPQMVNLPIPYKDSSQLEKDLDYHPSLPPTFNTETGFKQCAKPFFPRELTRQSVE